MKDIQDALARVGKSMAEIAQAVVKAIDELTPEQRIVIEFLAENPKVAEAFQELNQRLARQKAIGGATKETAQPKEPLIKDKKIRKAVREWAKMNMLERVAVNPPTKDCAIISFTYGMLEIGFFLGRSDISGSTYTIAELCGEEEE